MLHDYSESLVLAKQALVLAENEAALHRWARARGYLYEAERYCAAALQGVDREIEKLVDRQARVA